VVEDDDKNESLNPTETQRLNFNIFLKSCTNFAEDTMSGERRLETLLSALFYSILFRPADEADIGEISSF